MCAPLDGLFVDVEVCNAAGESLEADAAVENGHVIAQRLFFRRIVDFENDLLVAAFVFEFD